MHKEIRANSLTLHLPINQMVSPPKLMKMRNSTIVGGGGLQTSYKMKRIPIQEKIQHVIETVPMFF